MVGKNKQERRKKERKKEKSTVLTPLVPPHRGTP
jgi:hypothetical protein